MARVSIIMPAYNCGEYIRDAVCSVLIQTERSFELIVVNDGSTDNTLQIIDSLAANDQRIKVISQSNSGKPSIARNTGIKLAQGEYICFLDADDLYHPDKIKKSLELLDKYPEITAAFNDMKLIAKDGTEYESSFLGGRDFKQLASRYLTCAEDNIYLCSERFYSFMSTHFVAISTDTIMIRRSVLEQEGLLFPTDVAIGEDTEMWFRLAKGRKLAFIDAILSYYRQHETSITNNLEKWYSDPLVVLMRNFQWGQDAFSNDDVHAYKMRISREYFHKGYYQSELNSTEARMAYIQSLRWSFSLKTVFAYLKTFVPWVLVNHLKDKHK